MTAPQTTTDAAAALSASAGADAMRRLADGFIHFLETGDAPDGVFAPNVFTDATLPLWRVQADDVDGLFAIRRGGHPDPGRVPQHRVDLIPGGFVIEFTEAWSGAGGEWTSREMARADVRDGRIAALSVYCTGDWSPEHIAEHAAAVTLLRP